MADNNSSSTAFVPPFICSTPLLVFSDPPKNMNSPFSIQNQNPVNPNSTFAQLVSPCLANSLLPSMAAIFAIFSVIFIWFIGRSKFFGLAVNKPVVKSKLVYAKLLIPLFDLAVSLVELFIIFVHSSIPKSGEWAAREFHVQAIANALFSLCTILAYFECLQFGLISNGCLHLCWLFRLISILPSAILHIAHNSVAFFPKILPIYLHLLFAFIIVVLLFYADKLAPTVPENGYQRLEEEEMEFHGAKNPNPEAESSAAASLFYSYAAKMVAIGLRGTISYGQLWKLEKSNQSDVLRTRFYACHGEVRPKAEGKATNSDILKLFFGLLSSNWEFQLSSILLILFYALCQWSNALFLRLVVEWVTAAGNPIWLCAFALFCLFLMNVVGKLCEVRSDMQSFMTSYNIRSILTMIIYDKMMRLSSSAKKDYSCGEVNNLINLDVERIRMAFFQFKYIFYSLLLGTISLIGIFHEIGANALFGIGVILVMFPINFTFSWIQAKFEKIKMDLTDQRLKLCNDVLAGMKVLKLYAWEESMEKMIADIRKPEVTKICHLGILQSVETIAFHITPILSTLLSFFGYTILQRKALSPEIAFVSLLFFSMLQFCVYLLPMTVQATIKAFVSLGRVAAFLAKEEVEKERIVSCNDDTVDNGQNADAIVSLRNCSFTWENVHQTEQQTKMQLQSICMEVKAGQLVGIVGKVGSGKSSLLSAILGEMYLANLGQAMAKVRTKSIGYVPQQPWIQNKTLKANVLFDSPFLAGHYEEILEACALLADLKQLPAGDQTEIGERGINLSGGQKARVALARAVYRYPQLELFIFDDTLAAVDAHVAKHLFEKVIGPKGLLRKKTRVFALNTLAYLPHFDRIIVLDEGKISAQGKYAELIKLTEGPFVELMREHIKMLKNQQQKHVMDGPSNGGMDVPNNDELDTILANLSGSPLGHSLMEEHFLGPQKSDENTANLAKEESASNSNENGRFLSSAEQNDEQREIEENGTTKQTKNENDGRLVEAEEMNIGQVSSKVYTDYARAFGPIMSCAFFFFLFTGSTIFGSLSSIWLAKWSSEAAKSNSSVEENAWNLGIYGMLDAIWVLFTAISWIILSYGAYNASLHFHNRLIRSLFRSPMAFFDRTPTGRIQNRLSRDIESIDYEIPESLAGLMLFLADTLATLLSICLVIPWLLCVAIPLLTIFIVIVRIYTKSAVQFRRLSSTSWSHLCSFVQDTYLGADSIRAFNVLEQYRKLSTKVCDLTNECIMTDLTTNRWMQQRMNMLGDFALFICMQIAMLLAANGTIPVGILAMIITAGANFTGYFGEIARAWRYAETKMVSVERIGQYIDNEHEAEWTNAPGDNLAISETNWPSQGQIQFRDVCLRYRPDLDMVLSHLDCDIFGGEKIGIVGRTGAGKSSLTLALFRIIELCQGQILVDGIDIATLGLHKLRKALTIIPQDPVLFCGTLRSNLDPFHQYDDANLWTALEKAHLGELVQGNADKLEMTIADNGSNLSVGQRQLICLARALLRAETTRLLILDEATAAIDPDTDGRIQSTIRSNFGHSTILTIAHRLNTIIDYDRVLVMDRGQIAEFDTPAKLFHCPGSLFGQLAREAGISAVEFVKNG